MRKGLHTPYYVIHFHFSAKVISAHMYIRNTFTPFQYRQCCTHYVVNLVFKWDAFLEIQQCDIVQQCIRPNKIYFSIPCFVFEKSERKITSNFKWIFINFHNVYLNRWEVIWCYVHSRQRSVDLVFLIIRWWAKPVLSLAQVTCLYQLLWKVKVVSHNVMTN